MDKKIVTAFPSRPPVRVGDTLYQIIRPHALRALLDALAAEIYGRTDLPIEIRHEHFARVAAAAAVNALLD